MSHDNYRNQSGFTLIELMLSMTFIAVLLVAIAMTTVQISNIYTKGITLREVNQAGRAVSDELQRSVGSVAPFDVTPKDGTPATAASKYIVRDGGGRLCLGAYTYAWNYGKALAGGSGIPVFNTYSDNATPISFVKVADPGSALCGDPTLAITRSSATELLATGDRNLALHKFSIAKTTEDVGLGQALYAVSFTLGTNDRAQLTTNDASCKAPSEGVGDEDYCSVNQFEIVARAGNAAEGGE